MKNFDDIIDGKYRGNKIVIFLKEMCDTVDINKLWRMTDKGIFDKEELIELYKMIGYSIEGMNELFE